MAEPLWRPSESRVRKANLTAFTRAAEREWKKNFPNFRSLYRWSIEEPEEFWVSLWSFCDVVASRKWDKVLVDADRMPGSKWFEGARLNFSENLLRRRDQHPALIFRSERGERREISYAQLYNDTARLAHSLKSFGVTKGDRVVGFLPNIPETIIAMLATTALGAIWSSCSPEFGLQGALDRFGQITPKVLFTADGYSYNGKTIDSLERAGGLARKIPTLKNVVVIPYLESSPSISEIPNAISWRELLSGRAEELQFEQLPFNHPAYILYSSGTTGAPKCIVHGGGGALLQHLKEHRLHTDLKAGERIFYFTTCGWMMWNWMVSALASEATLILYEGSPMFPTSQALFDIAAEEQINVFGTSAGYLSAIQKAKLEPHRTHDLSALKAILSTGSPLAPRTFNYVYEKIKADLQLASISGGTDIVASFAGGNPTGAVYRGELQTRTLGMKVEIFNEEGQSIRGQKGELVCTAPFPSIPVGFWNDAGEEKFRAAYFEHYPNVWWHGDYAELTEHDGMIIYGRSDAVLNPQGVRIGTAEIYRQVDELDEVLEGLVVGQEWEEDVRIILFVLLRPGLILDERLSQEINDQIRSNTSLRHVPAKVIQVPDIPRTQSGKIVELAVREVIHNRPIKNQVKAALANPQALDFFKDLKELRD